MLFYVIMCSQNIVHNRSTFSGHTCIGKLNDKSGFPNEFIVNNNTISDKLEISESFNKYFSSVGLKTSQNVPVTNMKFTDYLPNPTRHSMFLEPVTPLLITNTTAKLKPKSSSGHDEISTKLLKETINNIIVPITDIINKSFGTGVVPHQMKIAKVVPIHKASDSNLLQNYRPISLLTAFSKLLEKLMYDKVISFLNSNNTLYKHQYGFRKKHSTIHPIIHLLNHCADVNNKHSPEFTLAIFCDLSKAFDVIDHRILLHKLSTYGIRGNVYTWFENYLSGRTQFVEMDGKRSSHQNIYCGVPQGSILGPLLYLIYVNDISKSCKCNILFFADDTTIYLSNSDLNVLYTEANIVVNDLYNWFCANKLSLNANKTKYIIIRPPHRPCNLENYHICINNTRLSRVGNNCSESSTKFLGIYIDECLTWRYHAAHINSKISRAIFAIKQLKFTVPLSILKTLYFALIQPHLSYGILAWGNAGSKILHKTIQLQKYAIRTIHKAAYNSHTDPLFNKSQILKLTDLYEYESVLFMYDFVENNLPRSFGDVFRYNRDVQNIRRTRQSDMIHVYRCHTIFSSRLPLYTLPIIWNKWAISAPGGVSRRRFGRHVKSTICISYPTQVRCKNKYCRDCR